MLVHWRVLVLIGCATKLVPGLEPCLVSPYEWIITMVANQLLSGMFLQALGRGGFTFGEYP
jgi:hypothetical protein